MRYGLEDAIKARLYLKFQEEHWQEGMDYNTYREYINAMVTYVQTTFPIEYEKENKEK